jgi:RecA/RadA recombinase
MEDQTAQQGKYFIDQYDKNTQDKQQQLPSCRAENIRFKAVIHKLPAKLPDWHKVEMNNWIQFNSTIDDIKVKLNMGKAPSIEFLPSPIYGNNPWELYGILQNDCNEAARKLEQTLDMKIGRLELEPGTEWVVYDPVADALCKYNGQITINGLGKINASKPSRRGAIEYFDPRTAAEYFTMPKNVSDIKKMLYNIQELLYSGKTQLCHTLSVMSQLNIAAATTLNDKKGVIYVDSDGTFRPERIVSIAQARRLDAKNALHNIIYVKAATSRHQELILKMLPSFIEKKHDNKKIKLLIVDSVITNYRAGFLGARMLSARQQKLYQFMCMLSSIAQTYGIAVVVTNQINSGHLNTAKPTGGDIMAHRSTYRVFLRRLCNNNKIVAKIVHSPYHPENEAHFILSDKGIEDKDNNNNLVCS